MEDLKGRQSETGKRSSRKVRKERSSKERNESGKGFESWR
jgi:hypothetical protein